MANKKDEADNRPIISKYQNQILQKLADGWKLKYHSRPASFGGNHFTLRRNNEECKDPRMDTIWKLVKLGFIRVIGDNLYPEESRFKLVRLP